MANAWDPVVGTPLYLETLKRAEDHAARRGWVLNSDLERLQKVVGLMCMNYADKGEFFCPCKQSHPLNPDVDVTCPCRELPDEIDADGHCFCRLFYEK